MAPVRVEEPDPVIGEYDVYITPELREQLYLLQYPTRAREYPYNNELGTKPNELRIKPTTRLVELDVPIPTTSNYNKEKAHTWGDALDKAQTESRNGFGIASGFGHGAALRGQSQKTAKSTKASDAMDVDDEDNRLNMKHLTLGGQIIRPEAGAPRYMIGTFHQNELHLTALDGVAQMRQQYSHIDAKTQIDRNRTRREREAAEGHRPVEPKQVQQSYKPLESDHLDTNHTKELLQNAQDEPWERYKYNDEELDESYQLYHDKLFVQDTKSAPEVFSSMNDEQYLDAISAPRIDPMGRSRVKPTRRRQKVTMETVDSDDEPKDTAGMAE